MFQTSLLLMKSLNKTETPFFYSAVCSLFPKAIFLMFIKKGSYHFLAREDAKVLIAQRTNPAQRKCDKVN